MVEPLDTAGTLPLTARTQPWMDRIVRNPTLCGELIETYGSPVNLHDFGALTGNIAELQAAAQRHGVALGVYFARKANKTFGAVQAAYAAGAGIDVASHRELEQCLALGVPGEKLILSAATKTPSTIDAALKALAVISVDNEDEFRLVLQRAAKTESEAQIALRLNVLEPGIAPSRFGLGTEHWLDLVGKADARRGIKVRGVHFHLNGYSAQERSIGILAAILLIDQLRGLGHRPQFIDMGGGVPVNYLTSREQWRSFWEAVADGRGTRKDAPMFAGEVPPAASSASAALGLTSEDSQSPAQQDFSTLATSCWGGPPVIQPGSSADTGEDPIFDPVTQEIDRLLNPPATWRGDTLGLVDPESDRPSPMTYPYFQDQTRGTWLDTVLGTPVRGLIPDRDNGDAADGDVDGGGSSDRGIDSDSASESGSASDSADVTVAQELNRRNLELRCEPGRALMDGCGMTIAQVAARQVTSDGIELVVLYMNRTQMRSTSADYLVDPIHMRPLEFDVRQDRARVDAEPYPVEGAYLVGSYCIEEELIMRRAFDFPQGVEVGDLIAFPNTGGYFMHILESASHQIPLAANLVFDSREEPSAGDDPQSDVARTRWVQDAVDLVNPAGGQPL